MARTRKPLRLAVFASGGGRTLENLVQMSRTGRLAGEVVVAISNRADAFVLTRARRLGISAQHAEHNRQEITTEILELLARERVDLCLLAGYVRRMTVTETWQGRMMNIHPSLLPAFGGKGYYGRRVHQAVRDSGVKFTGCTVHFVDGEYDHGPIILQRTVAVRFEDSADEIAARVFEAEKLAYPEAINLFATGRLALRGERVQILP